MYVVCLNVSQFTRVKARSLRSRVPPWGPRGAPTCSECQISLATLANSSRRARRANRRSLQHGNLMTKLRAKRSKWAMNGPFNRGIAWQKLPKRDQNGQQTGASTREFHVKSAENDENRRKRIESVGTPGNVAHVLPQCDVALYPNFTVV